MKGGYSMNCPHCQNPVDDNTVFCPVCGQAVQSAPAQNAYEQQPYSAPTDSQQQSYTAPDSSYQQNGANLGDIPQGNYQYQNPQAPYQAPQFPMKWFKFIIYFQLFLTMVTCVFNAITFFTGLHYGSAMDAAMVYAYYGMGLKVVDIIFGLIYIGIGVFAFLVRQKLAHFKKKAPQRYIGLLISTLAANLLYMMIVSILTGMFLLDASTIGNIIGNVIMIVINWIYFQKRTSLFIND